MDFSEIELAAVFHNQLWLTEKASKDIDFKKKFGTDLESVSTILRKINFSRGLSVGSIANCRRQLQDLDWDFPLPKRNVSTVQAKMETAIYTKWRTQPGVEVKRLPPEKYIGKGYRDKGTAQRPEIDGNPAWQEVASASANKLRQIEELRDELERTEGPKEKIFNATKLTKLIIEYRKFSSR